MVFIIKETEPDVCTDCGKTEELRPYGIDGAWVCFACAMKDEDNAEQQLQKIIDGSNNPAGNC